MILAQTYYFLDGQVLQIGQWPRTVTSRKPDVPPKHIFRHPFTERQIEVEPIAGLPDCWRELGLQGNPPAPNDLIVNEEIPLHVIDLPLESAMQKGKWLVETINGLIWIIRAFDTLPIWKLASENASCP